MSELSDTATEILSELLIAERNHERGYVEYNPQLIKSIRTFVKSANLSEVERLRDKITQVNTRNSELVKSRMRMSVFFGRDNSPNGWKEWAIYCSRCLYNVLALFSIGITAILFTVILPQYLFTVIFG
jgi:hypothetical protein